VKVCVLIPALKPCDRLLKLLADLLEREPALRVILVNDGSPSECQAIFDQAATRSQVEVLTHLRNLGKGAALRTGIQRFLQVSEPTEILVTADADGQHLPEDILAVAAEAGKKPMSLVMGIRSFGEGVPWRSQFGNNLTRLVFRLFTRIDLHDTQTGLRAIPRSLLPQLMEVRANRYSFELEMLLIASRGKTSLLQTPIQTVYIDGNSDSHFNPILDSLRVYWVFVRYLLPLG
jgi:glycosyltransferase involved in cell wall biosynthesis